MSRKGFRAGYHPTPDDLQTLELIDKKKRRYADKHGREYSNRAVQEARMGYVTIEEAKELRAKGWGDLLSWRKRGEIPWSVHRLAKMWEQRKGYAQGSAMRSPRFRRDLEKQLRLSKRAFEDEDYYSDAEEFADDTFGMEFEEMLFGSPSPYAK